jgi:hypothetical protein
MAKETIEIAYNTYESEDVTEKVKCYYGALKAKAQLEKQLKEMNKYLASLNANITEQMVGDNLTSIEHDEIKFEVKVEDTFSLDTEATGHKKWDNELFFNWLQEIGEQDIIKMKESVHPATRDAFLKAKVNEGMTLPPWIIHKNFQHLKFNKSAIERKAGTKA